MRDVILLRLKWFAPKEVRAVIDALDEARLRLDSSAYRTVRSIAEDLIWGNAKEVIKATHEGISPHQHAYSLIANVAGDLLETGRYHIHSGWLNPLDIGSDLLRLFDIAIDEMVSVGAIDEDSGRAHKSALLDRIAEVG